VSQSEDHLARVEHYVREGEKYIAQQLILLERLARSGRAREAAEAKALLMTLRQNLRLARDHLRLAREARGSGA
jgi:hypothetical protein